MGNGGEFFENDESFDEIQEAWHDGEHGVTAGVDDLSGDWRDLRSQATNPMRLAVLELMMYLHEAPEGPETLEALYQLAVLIQYCRALEPFLSQVQDEIILPERPIETLT